METYTKIYNQNRKGVKLSYLVTNPNSITMKNRSLFILILTLFLCSISSQVLAQPHIPLERPDQEEPAAGDKLVVLWTSGDREVALKMVFMYTYNAQARGWWDEVTLVVWGPSAKLLTEDRELQEYMAKIMEAGVNVKACKGCSDQYGVSEELEELGVTVLYIGKELTDYLKEGRKILTI